MMDSSVSILLCRNLLVLVKNCCPFLSILVRLTIRFVGSPIEPQNVTVDDIDQASVKISWKQPIEPSNDIVYRIECNHLIEGRSVPCESYISYYPNRTFINSTRYLNAIGQFHDWHLFDRFSVQILGLDADTNYNVEVYAEQLSTHLLSKSVDLSFTTKRPSMKKTLWFQFVHFSSFSTETNSWYQRSTYFIEYHFNYLVIEWFWSVSNSLLAVHWRTS